MQVYDRLGRRQPATDRLHGLDARMRDGVMHHGSWQRCSAHRRRMTRQAAPPPAGLQPTPRRGAAHQQAVCLPAQHKPMCWRRVEQLTGPRTLCPRPAAHNTHAAEHYRAPATIRVLCPNWTSCQRRRHQTISSVASCACCHAVMVRYPTLPCQPPSSSTSEGAEAPRCHRHHHAGPHLATVQTHLPVASSSSIVAAVEPGGTSQWQHTCFAM